MYNYFILIGIVKEVLRIGYNNCNVIRLENTNEFGKTNIFTIYFYYGERKDYEALIGKTISVKGRLDMTNLIELIGERIISTERANE